MTVYRFLLISFFLTCPFLLQNIAAADDEGGLYAEDYDFVTGDGAWCWFSDPRAIYLDNVVYGGFVDREGSIWAFSYDPVTSEKKQCKIYDRLQYDDHAAPSVLALPDKRIVIFFSAHGPSPIYYAVSSRPEDITGWEEVRSIEPDVNGNRGYCYTNPVMLSGENNKVYLFFRGPNFKPCVITSDDLKTWSQPLTVVDKRPGKNAGGRPYMKVASDGKDKIFLAFTDGHPRGEPLNSIYFLMYKDGAFYKADGTKVSDGFATVYPDMADKVYDASETFDKAWIWDVAVAEDGNPVLVYARFSNANNEHSYWYAKWNGTEWDNINIASAGEWFMRNDYNNKNLIEKENNYSAGVYLDHNAPNTVYASVPVENVFEIGKWTLSDDGKWTRTAVTRDSERDNVRPFVIRDYPDGYPELLWMYNYSYPGFRAYDTAIRINRKADSHDASMDTAAIASVATKVFDWQMRDWKENPQKCDQIRGWRAGVMYAGMFDWADITGDNDRMEFIAGIFSDEKWQLGNRMYHADDICVGQTYLDMYFRQGKREMLLPTAARLEWIISHPPGKNIDNTKGKSDRWWWCDALYMAPAVFVRLWNITGNKAFMKFADEEYRASYEQLYDSQEGLFFRDSKSKLQREANGRKVFWSRGNGWVLAGLAEILKNMPEHDRKYRQWYEELFCAMSRRIVSLQQPDGFWRSSLLDPEAYPYPETSGTGLFVYALAYGINAGYLDRETYLPAVEKGWKALVSAVDTEGKLCWVQPIGSAPKDLKKKDTQLYGVGAFLCAASEIYDIVRKDTSNGGK